jgi:hypothetical protein
MLSFENGPDIETVSNASEFLGHTLYIWENYRVLVYFIRKWTVPSRLFHYGASKFLWVFSKYQIMCYVLNFVVEILLNLTRH